MITVPPRPGRGCAALPTVAPDAGAWFEVGRPGVFDVLVVPPAAEVPEGTALGVGEDDGWLPPLDPPLLPPLGAGRVPLPPPPVGAGRELVGRPPPDWPRRGAAEAGIA